MLNTDHHLKAAVKRVIALVLREREEDVELSATIVNIDEQALINFCKERGETYRYVVSDKGLFKNLRATFISEKVIVFLVGIPVPNVNPDECHVD